MESEWIEASFSELCDITRGASPRPIHEWISTSGTPWVKISDATASQSRFITKTGECIKNEARQSSVVVNVGDLIVSNSATPGIPKIMGIEACIHDGWLLLRNLRGLDKMFAYYLLLRDRPALVEQGNGSVFTNLKTEILKNHRVKIPLLAEQKRIAGILGALDDKIELNRKMNETLEQMARVLFKSWFIDFDPVHAKAAGRQPVGMDKATAALFPDSFVDSELGKIPKGWKSGALDELVEPRVEKVAATPDKDLTRYIALEDMPSKSLELSKYQLGSAVNSSIIRFRKGDILFGSMRVYFHKVGLACFDGITRTTTFVLKPRKERLRHFSLLHLFSDEVIAFATTASIGTTIPYVRWDSLRKYRLAIPPDELLSRFDELVGNLTSKIATQGEESRTLADLRDSLLPRLLSGNLNFENNDTSA